MTAPPPAPPVAVAPAPAARLRGPERPLRAVVLFAALLGLGLAAAYGVSEAVDPLYRGSRERYERVMAAAPSVEALALGNSHSGAIDFGVLDVEGYRLWNSGGDLYEVLHLFRSVRPHLTGLDYVFVPVSPFVVDNAASPSRVERRKEVYVTTGRYTPVEGDWAVAFQALVAPVVRWDNWEGVAYRMAGSRRPNPRQADEEEPLPGDSVRALSAPQLRLAAATRARFHRSLETTSRAANPTLCEDARAALREIVALSAPARVVFFTPPYSEPYRRLLDPTLGCGLDRHAAALAAASPRATYFDDRALEGFTDDARLFRDADHLNARGARRYSQHLAMRLGLTPNSSPPPAAR